ncbi:MAG: hypothetical protein PUB17_07525 [Lachnospiraceae bacterium]|nr:hypothetical protein [Lachnospiraceae bacterium]
MKKKVLTLLFLTMIFLTGCASKSVSTDDNCNFPGEISDVSLNIDGSAYKWKGLLTDLPDGCVYVHDIEGNYTGDTPVDYGMYADFKVSGRIYMRDYDRKAYAYVTTDWLDNRIVVFKQDMPDKLLGIPVNNIESMQSVTASGKTVDISKDSDNYADLIYIIESNSGRLKTAGETYDELGDTIVITFKDKQTADINCDTSADVNRITVDYRKCMIVVEGDTKTAYICDDNIFKYFWN